MSNTIIIALHRGDKTTCCAAIWKTADSETCLSQGSIPGSTLSLCAFGPLFWLDKEKICVDFLILSNREIRT